MRALPGQAAPHIYESIPGRCRRELRKRRAAGRPFLAALRPRAHLPAVQAGPSAVPYPSSATRPPRIGGPGSSSPSTPSCAWPGHWLTTLRLPWEQPAPPGRLTPARVRRGFRNIRAAAPCPAGAPNPTSPAPAARQGRATADPHQAMKWENNEEETHDQGTARNAQAKQQD